VTGTGGHPATGFERNPNVTALGAADLLLTDARAQCQLPLGKPCRSACDPQLGPETAREM
jgi:hypothetical protein